MERARCLLRLLCPLRLMGHDLLFPELLHLGRTVAFVHSPR